MVPVSRWRYRSVHIYKLTKPSFANGKGRLGLLQKGRYILDLYSPVAEGEKVMMNKEFDVDLGCAWAGGCNSSFSVLRPLSKGRQ